MGEKAPDFTLTDVLGNEVNLYDELANGQCE
ncbi:peroxiredoxin family protein [Alicyclobacillus acidoterrestris]|uniref:Peroxiredoxin family protein n=1 Tax=Alicyclobacillus acidoterrestris (strain ATCC 49025 / DSM 3922 / CIP 106132 / NCIMB 13137 / GD3B) TaxID=1356854 RepID=T0BNL5_ALIAG|nr:hypothetical protein N007_15050 [Alicyclobacillus acidoterrestris ATCC 49025]UNO50484.1 peroxiredoxin family protein [Alicyclobacillus acidoterrestris]